MSQHQSAAGPLAGLRVIDFSIQAAGPWAGSLFGMLGAEVIKVERPTGDGTRFAMPRQRGMGTNYIALNVNKKNIIVDLKTPEGRQTALDLARTSDILIENLRVGVMDRLGLGYTEVNALNNRIIYCSVTGFGRTGPLAKAGCGDGVMQAFSGFARANGAPGQAMEAFRFTGLLDFVSAAVAMRAMLAALLERDATGAGQYVSVSMLEAALEAQCTRVADLLYADLDAVPRGSESYGFVPDRAIASLDREIFVTVRTAAEWRGFCAAIEQPELAGDPRFSSNRERVAHRDELHALIEPVFKTRPAIWWLRVFQRHGVPASVAHDFESFRYHEQVLANRMIVPLHTRAWGTLTVGGAPWHFAATPESVCEPAQPGEHTEALLGELRNGGHVGTAGERYDERYSGLRVVELADGIAGPLAGLRLAELGADVVKVETAPGDWLRDQEPFLCAEDTSAAHYDLNRGKRYVWLDSDRKVAADTLRTLLLTADILITDHRADELNALGINGSADIVFPENPRLIAVCISDWGRHGPLARHGGSELTTQAMSGYTRYLGTYGDPAVRIGADIASASTGIFAGQAVLTALYSRKRTGVGQRVDVSLLNSLLAMKGVHLAAQSDADAYDRMRVGAANHPPHRGWRTADAPVLVKFGGSVGSEGRYGWVDFVKEIGLERLLDDPRCDREGRLTTGAGINALDLRPVYEAVFSRYTAEQLFEMITRHGGDASVYISLRQALDHPQTKILGVIHEVQDATGRTRAVRRFPSQFSSLKLDESISAMQSDGKGETGVQHHTN